MLTNYVIQSKMYIQQVYSQFIGGKAMFRKKIRRIFSIILAVSISVLVLSACKETGNETEETTVSETIAKYSDEELELMAQDMPEIVFVMSHHYDNSNIVGYYVTNTGEIKLYDFRQIAPDETYEIPDVYERLEEAVCLEIPSSEYSSQEQSITISGQGVISHEILIEQYKKLLMVNQESPYDEHESLADMIQGDYNLYGIRCDINNKEKEFVLLYSGGDYIFKREDDNANELAVWMRHEEDFYNIFHY